MFWDYLSFNLSSIASEFVYLFVYLFPNSSKTMNPNELKFWGMIPLGVQMVLG